MSKPHDPSRGDVKSPEELGAFWDGKYEAGELFGDRPNAFIRENAAGLDAGRRALVPGDGYGRNGIWLAGQGHAVTSLDVSPLGAQMARAGAEAAGVEMEVVVADLTVWPAPAGAFDLIAVAFVHIPAPDRPAVHAKYAEALAPGGLLLFQAYSQSQLGRTSGGPKSLELLYTTQQLEADFSGLAIDRLSEDTVDLDEGSHHRGPASVINLIARKPAP